MHDYLKGVKSNFEKLPSIQINSEIIKGWESILAQLLTREDGVPVLAIECYIGVDIDELSSVFADKYTVLITSTFFKSNQEVEAMTYPDVTDDEVFGFITRLNMIDFFDGEKIKVAQNRIAGVSGPVIVIGPGALLIAPFADVKVYADMARWEIQKRMKANKVDGLGVISKTMPFGHQYKRGFFVDWRVCDKHKKDWFLKCDYLLDTNKSGEPKLVEMSAMKKGFEQAVQQPFSVVPFFDPGPWGGQWMKQVCNLEESDAPNHAWCFNCVPEENSILFRINDEYIELPAINLVFFQSKELLGDAVEARFGKEFPIRFDFLDTMDGGNLSLQVHPDTTYIQENFGMNYTQDESYYLLDAEQDSFVYLGLKENADFDEMLNELRQAQDINGYFDADKYINKFPARKHDHFLIPAGTIHCSGKNSMVLEISATPYIFTFKMWDWDRLGLDGKPRAINIAHAGNVVDTTRDIHYVKKELINQIKKIDEGDGWIEERTGLHRREFIETRRFWFSKPVTHHANGSVNVLMLVEGREAIVESPEMLFMPFIVHYAEAFIIPAAIKSYRISPYGESKGKRIAVIKAYVRT